MNELTIIYYTDNCVADSIGNLVRNQIQKSGKSIISVSQKPIDFGKNICVGDIGRSYKNIQTQILAGITAAKTRYIALSEHDTLYPDGYFDWIPPTDKIFYYNKNRVFVVAKKGPQYGMYIFFEETNPNEDQLTCNRELLIEAVQKRINLIESNPPTYPKGWCEPGVSNYFEGEKYKWHRNKIASIDIFHNENFTVRNGTFTETGYCLEGWGKWKDILCTV